MLNSAAVRVRVNGLAGQEMKTRIFTAVQETFELDIKPEAQRTSPVSPTWPSIPASRGEKRIDTGTNRRSIDTEMSPSTRGLTATLFTQSGYGGYLETGTAHMPARPYLYPAVMRFIDSIAARVKGEKP